MEGKIYHASPIGGLTELTPKVSTHGKSYVYGTKNFELALFFGSSKTMRDFDGDYGVKTLKNDGEAIPFFYEAYEGALKRRFKGESCYVYELDPTDFETEKTSFKAEVVSEKPVKVLNCVKVDDIYEYLMNAMKQNKVIFKFYSLDDDYQELIQKHIKSRLPYIVNCKESNAYCFCKEKFPKLLAEVEKEIENIN